MFKQYTLGTEKRWSYRREYKGQQLRKKGFLTKGQADISLRKAMEEVDSPQVVKITTLQDAYNNFREYLISEADRKEKGQAYRYGITTTLNKLDTFVLSFGPDRAVREIQKIDLTKWFLALKADGIAQASASTYLGRLGGMLSYAQQNQPDLANWNRPKLHERAKLSNPGRVVSREEYKALLGALASPPACNRIKARTLLWRDCGDAVRLLRNTGARLNEILCLKMVQIDLEQREVELYATKTERERTVPLSESAIAVIGGRIKDGLVGGDFLFSRAVNSYFPGEVEKAVGTAARAAELTYGRKVKGGFTLHGLRHTYITELLAAGVDIPTVMKYSGHKSLATFSVYLHATVWGQKKALQRIEMFDDCLEETSDEERKETA